MRIRNRIIYDLGGLSDDVHGSETGRKLGEGDTPLAAAERELTAVEEEMHQHLTSVRFLEPPEVRVDAGRDTHPVMQSAPSAGCTHVSSFAPRGLGDVM